MFLPCRITVQLFAEVPPAEGRRGDGPLAALGSDTLGNMPVSLVARVVDTQANQSFDATFDRFPVRIGRHKLNDLPLDRPYVSQFHVALDVRGSQVFVKDLGSTNGTVHAGARIGRDATIDVTGAPEIAIGPILIRLQLVNSAGSESGAAAGTVKMKSPDALDAARFESIKLPPPGQESPFVAQAVPYVEAYRAAWAAVYRVVYDHLARLPPDVRASYLKRLAIEHPALGLEPDFRKIAKYYDVDPISLGEVRPEDAALIALGELASRLAPRLGSLDNPEAVVTFARRLRDAVEVFLSCFVSLRDGHHEFETEVLAKDRGAPRDRVALAKDAGELGDVLFDGTGQDGEAARKLHDIFVDVMSHQVALLNGVMEGVKTLLTQLSPATLEEELERRGKRGGLFSNRFEELWKLYEVRHGDYSGAYAATAAEEDRTTGEPGGKALPRFTIAASQAKR